MYFQESRRWQGVCLGMLPQKGSQRHRSVTRDKAPTTAHTLGGFWDPSSTCNGHLPAALSGHSKARGSSQLRRQPQTPPRRGHWLQHTPLGLRLLFKYHKGSLADLSKLEDAQKVSIGPASSCSLRRSCLHSSPAQGC